MALVSSFEHLKSLLNSGDTFARLSSKEKMRAAYAARDVFFQVDLLVDEDKEVFRQAIAIIEPQSLSTLEGHNVSFHPAGEYREVRFVQRSALPESTREHFINQTSQLPHLVPTFVRAEEFNYWTLENLIPLDRLYEKRVLELSPAFPRQVAEEEGIYSFDLECNEETAESFQLLRELGLYRPPLNRHSRGGERYIFHLERLARALTGALRDWASTELEEKFQHVNPVFRMNRFAPGDAPFSLHRDNPYSDMSRNHISRYSLLIYLTPGEGEPVIRIGETEIRSVGSLTCVVFDQRHAHAGFPFREGTKEFLRTELIFQVDDLEHDPRIGELFTKACYFAAESLLRPQLEPYVEDNFDRVAKARLSGLSDEERTEPYLYRQYQGKGMGTDYVTNGHDYWFPKSQFTLKTCAFVSLLDQFNGHFDFHDPFRSQCTTKVIESRDSSFIEPLFLSKKRRVKVRHFDEYDEADLDKAGYFPPPELAVRECRDDEGQPLSEEEYTKISDEFSRAQAFTKQIIADSLILSFHNKMWVNSKNIFIKGNEIHILSSMQREPLHFAASNVPSPNKRVYVGAVPEKPFVQTLYYFLAPIVFYETEVAYHLTLDLFRSTWMMNSHQRTMTIPRINKKRDWNGWHLRTSWGVTQKERKRLFEEFGDFSDWELIL